jgi:hypothetical protein
MYSCAARMAHGWVSRTVWHDGELLARGAYRAICKVRDIGTIRKVWSCKPSPPPVFYAHYAYYACCAVHVAHSPVRPSQTTQSSHRQCHSSQNVPSTSGVLPPLLASARLANATLSISTALAMIALCDSVRSSRTDVRTQASRWAACLASLSARRQYRYTRHRYSRP